MMAVCWWLLLSPLRLIAVGQTDCLTRPPLMRLQEIKRATARAPSSKVAIREE
jgi:hypothetical protein